jgi:pyruvate decarboxylase
MEAPYNQVPVWAYNKLCETFGPSFPSRYYRVETGDELVELFSDPKFNSNDCTQVGLHPIQRLVAI